MLKFLTKSKIFVAFIGIVMMVTVFAGCAAADTNSVGGGDSVVIAIPPDAEPAAGFDPITGWSEIGHSHNPLIQSRLLIVEDDVTIGYDLATDYTVSGNGLVWTFHLRSDVKFTNGDPLTAKDVAFTFNAAKDVVTDLDLSMLKKAEATDDTTVVFTLNYAYSPFAYIVGVMGIVPEQAYDKATYWENPIGSGPFILKQWDKGEQVIFEANPDYYGEVSKIKKMTVVFMTEDTAYAAAQAGQVDVATTSALYTVSPIAGYRVQSFKSVDHRELTLPVLPAGSKGKKVDSDEEIEVGNDVTGNLAVRQAISYAIDRQAIADTVFYGYATPAYSNSPGMPWENEAAKVEYDPDKAKAIMEADGWVRNSDGIYEKDGLLAEFTVTCTDDSGRQSILAATKEMLDEFGIRINIKSGMIWDEIDPTTYTTPYIMGGGQFSPISDIGRFYTGKNRVSYSNKIVDKHMDDGLAASSLEEAYKHFKLAAWDGTTGYITDADSPYLFIVTLNHLYFVRNGLNVVDEQVFPHGGGWSICNNVNKWSWD